MVNDQLNCARMVEERAKAGAKALSDWMRRCRVKACPHLMRIGCASGRCPYLFSNFAGTATLYVLIALPHDGSRSKKHGVFRGIVGACVVPADWLHQAVQVSSERQDEKVVQPEETTTSACPKRLIKALISPAGP